MTSQACDLLEGLIPNKEDTHSGSVSAVHMEKLFIFSLMWSIGALMELDDRDRIEQFMKDHSSKLALPPVQQGETIFEYVVDDQGECRCTLMVWFAAQDKTRITVPLLVIGTVNWEVCTKK